jgi:hypothetical protein
MIFIKIHNSRIIPELFPNYSRIIPELFRNYSSTGIVDEQY